MAINKFAVTPGFEVGGTVFKPDQLAALGSFIGEDAQIELTTFKQLYVAMDEEHVNEVQHELRKTGLQIQPAGSFTKSLVACNFCKGAEDAGLELARALDKSIAGIEVPSPLKIGYAGCALGTSEPLLKDISVVKMNDVYDIYVGGEPKGLKPRFAQPFMVGIKHDKLILIVISLIKLFQTSGKKKEKFCKFVDRITMENLRELCR